MYGITPSAKIDSLDSAPPENTLKISTIDPRVCSNNAATATGSTPGNGNVRAKPKHHHRTKDEKNPHPQLTECAETRETT